MEDFSIKELLARRSECDRVLSQVSGLGLRLALLNAKLQRVDLLDPVLVILSSAIFIVFITSLTWTGPQTLVGISNYNLIVLTWQNRNW